MTVYNNKTYRIEGVKWTDTPNTTFEVRVENAVTFKFILISLFVFRAKASKKVSPATT